MSNAEYIRECQRNKNGGAEGYDDRSPVLPSVHQFTLFPHGWRSKRWNDEEVLMFPPDELRRVREWVGPNTGLKTRSASSYS